MQQVNVSKWLPYKSFDMRATALGYACFGVPASRKARDGREQGRVVLLVSKLYKSRLASKFSSCGGQASLVWVNGSLFGSCYAARDNQRLDFLKELLVCVGTQ